MLMIGKERAAQIGKETRSPSDRPEESVGGGIGATTNPMQAGRR